MMRRLGQAFVAFLLFAGFQCLGCQWGNRPNVLFFAVDDMKDWVNCLGGYEGTVTLPTSIAWPSAAYCLPTPIVHLRNALHPERRS
ncbi:MAG: hypothetical protein Ct9H300mP7_5760 [Verrucomicrobiota bacterium]|nr:MAG: hypothetical protein Ct9H300mP7_5760 [Verrucomicrobiota bacterium]